MDVKPVILQGNHVRLEPMSEAHAPALAEIGIGQPFWDFMVYGKMNEPGKFLPTLLILIPMSLNFFNRTIRSAERESE